MSEKKRPSVKKRKVVTPNRNVAAQDCEHSQAPAGTVSAGEPPSASKPSQANAQEGKAVRGKRPSLRSRRTGSRAVLGAVAAVLVLAISIGAAFSIDRWACDDREAIQGDWRIEGSETVIPITDATIQLAVDATYDYQLDTFAKTIDFGIGNLQGQGRYCFFDGGNTLLIQDGEWGLLNGICADLPAKIAHFVGGIFSDNPPLPHGDDVAILRRVASPAAASVAGGAAEKGDSDAAGGQAEEEQSGAGDNSSGETSTTISDEQAKSGEGDGQTDEA